MISYNNKKVKENMKTINLEFNKIPEYIPQEIMNEKLENLNFLLYYFHSKKINENGRETNETKRRDILKFLLKEYFNILLVSNPENKLKFQEYEDKLNDFLKDKVKSNDIEFILAKEFEQEFKERKDVVRKTISKLNVKINNNNEAIVFQYGEIYINETNLNSLIRGKLTPETLTELTQTWMIFQLNRYIGLDNAFISKDVDTEKAKEFFKKSLNYEVILTERLRKNVSYEIFWEALNILNKEIGLTKESQKKIATVFTNEIHDKSDQLFVNKNNVFYFNESNVNFLLNEPFNKERKKELTKLYLFFKLFDKIKNPDYLSESMFLIPDYAQQTKEKLFAQVSKNFVTGVYDEVKSYFSKANINIVNYDLGCHASDTMLLKDRNQIIFNLEMANKKLVQETPSEEEKNQFALLYVFSELMKLNDFKMKSWNKEEQIHETVEFININKINELKGEKYLKAISGLNTNKLLNVVHTFFKGLILDNDSQEYFHNEILLNLLKANTLQTGKNKEKLLIINKNLVLFNEENMNYQEYDNTLKAYVFDKIFKSEKELTWLQDNSVTNIEKHIPAIIEELKNKISEKDIYLKIKEIEKDLELEPKEKYDQFNDLSVELDAKNDLSFMKNDMVVFKHEKKTALSTAFIRLEILNKLLNKTIDSYNVKELVKLCLFSKLNEVKESVLRNKSDHLIVLNENCHLLKERIPEIIEKISGKVLEQEINTAIVELNEHLPFDGNEDFLKRNVVNEIKRQVGIKVKSPFKHLL